METGTLGVIQQLRGQNFAIFCPPGPLHGQFLYPERGQKQTFFDLLHLVHVVIEWSLSNAVIAPLRLFPPPMLILGLKRP